MHSDTKTIRVVFLGILLSVAIFVIDIATPLGVAGGVPYVAVIMLALWSARMRTALYFAILCSVLTVLGIFLSPQGGQMWQVLVNRFLALFAIWITAILSMQRWRGVQAVTSAHEFGRILEQSLNEIYVFDAESLKFLLVNRGARENLGYSMSELRELTPLDLKPQFSPGGLADLMRPLRTGEQQIVDFQTVHRRKDGTTYPVEVHLQLTSFEHSPAFLAVILDITRQRQTESDLQSAHEELQHIMASVSDCLWSAEIDEEGIFKYRYYSPVVQRITGRPAEFFMEGPHKWLSTVHPEDEPRLQSTLEKIQNSNNDFVEGEYRIILPDNRTRWVRDSVKVTQLEDGSRRLFGVVSDISDTEARFQTTFEQAAVGITHVAPDGRFLRVNQKLCDILGYDRKELLNCTFQDITHPDELDEDLSNVQRLLAGEIKTYSMDKRYFRKDRSLVWGHLTVSLVRDKSGEPKYFISVVEDISERKRAEEALRQSDERFDLAARGSNDGLWDWDIISDSEWWSTRYYELLGYEDGEIEATHVAFQESLHPDDKQRTLAALKAHLEDRVPYDIEYRLRRKSGAYLWFSARGQANWNEAGAPVRMAGSIRDITDRMLAEEKLQRYTHDLEVANRDLQEFAFIVSHDLREPLRAVSGFCSLLQQKYEGLLDENGKEFMQHIVSGASRMGDLLNGLLAYSRVGTHGAAFEQVDCNEVLDIALANLHAAIEESNAHIEHDALPTLECDKTQLVQLFQNLIANAIKYRSQHDPQIHIGVARDAASWRFSVQDNGIGFDSRHSERIYDIFRRLHTRDEYSGMGVGLAICKRIVQRHGGRIWSESEPGVGSTFYFSFSQPDQGDQP